jgi:hypothetical protein
MFRTLMFITCYTCCHPHCELTPHTIMCVRHEYKTLSGQVSYEVGIGFGKLTPLVSQLA